MAGDAARRDFRVGVGVGVGESDPAVRELVAEGQTDEARVLAESLTAGRERSFDVGEGRPERRAGTREETRVVHMARDPRIAAGDRTHGVSRAYIKRERDSLNERGR